MYMPYIYSLTRQGAKLSIEFKQVYKIQGKNSLSMLLSVYFLIIPSLYFLVILIGPAIYKYFYMYIEKYYHDRTLDIVSLIMILW